jgi:GT2 family glycosyltransferase
MRQRPRVTAVIPARNVARFIAEALESVRAQDFPDFEAVVVDDGSSDETFEIASRFASEDERFSVIPARGRPGEAEPVEAGPARNIAMRRSRAELVAFLDADDTWLPHRLRCGVRVFERNPEVGLAYGLTVRTDEAGRPLRDGKGMPVLCGRGHPGLVLEPVSRLLWPGNVATINAIMVRRDLALRVGGFDAGFHEDWRFNFKVSAFAPFHCTPEVLATYRQHGSARSERLSHDDELENREILEVHRDSVAWLARLPRHRRLARRLAAEQLPAHLVRASMTRRGRVRRTWLFASTLRAMWDFPSLAFSPHTLRVALALVGGGKVYQLLRNARERLAPEILFPKT